jgi:hypothetical protein
MKKSLTALSLLALCAASFASPAKATIVYVTVIGTVSSSDGPQVDVSGLFGGGDLSGDAYTAQYAFNTSLGATMSSTAANYAYGGSGSYAPSPPNPISPSLGASLTISGHTYSITGTEGGEIYGYNNGAVSETLAFAANANFYLQSLIYGLNSAISASITTPFSIEPAYDDEAESDFVGGEANLKFGISLYTLSLIDPTAVPEPASIALFGIGILGLGWLRRGVTG